MPQWFIHLIISIIFAIFLISFVHFMQPKYQYTKFNQTEQTDIIEEDLTTECKNTLLAIIATCQVFIVILQALMVFLTVLHKTIEAINYFATILFK